MWTEIKAPVGTKVPAGRTVRDLILIPKPLPHQTTPPTLDRTTSSSNDDALMAIQEMQACLSNYTLYMFGGGALGHTPVPDNAMHRLDLATGAWTQPTPTGVDRRPEARFGHSLLRLGDVLYMTSGMSATTCFNDLWVYDLGRLTGIRIVGGKARSTCLWIVAPTPCIHSGLYRLIDTRVACMHRCTPMHYYLENTY